MADIIDELKQLYDQVEIPFNRFKQSLRKSGQCYITKKSDQISILMNTNIRDQYYFNGIITISGLQIKIKCLLMKNYKPLNILSLQMQKSIRRILTINSANKNYHVVISISGQIQFIYHTIIAQRICYKIFKQNAIISKFIIQNFYRQAINGFKVGAEQIISIIQYYEKLTQQKFGIQLVQKVDLIKQYRKFCHNQPKQIKKQTAQIIKPLRYKNHQGLQTFALYASQHNNSTEQQQKLLFFHKFWYKNPNYRKQVYKTIKFAQIKKMIQSYLITNKYQDMQNPQILCNISVDKFSLIKWGHFQKGGSGCLYYGKVNYCQNNNQQQQNKQSNHINEYLILKMDPKKVKSKVFVEKLIIQQIKNNTSKYLPRYYICKEIEQRSAIMMEYIPLKSLSEWSKNYGIYISIFTKLNICISICQGLTFLHQNHIIHRDLKLANILIKKDLTPKICDFGESYHPKVAKILKDGNLDIKPGYTLPYTPIQYFTKPVQQLTDTSYDIFSLGFVLYEILFSRQLLNNSMKNLIQKFKQQTLISSLNEPGALSEYYNMVIKKIYLAPQSLQNYGSTQLIYNLLILIRKCLSLNPEDRPSLKWIIVILSQTHEALQIFYSRKQ